MGIQKADTGPRKTAIYIRVSTSMQADRDSLPMQKKDLTAYSELILGIPDYEIFEDAGYSGKDTERPAYQQMMARIQNREFSHLLVWKIDRISRNLIDFSEMYSELKKLRVIFVSKNEQFDTSTAMGEAMLKIILVFAELERNMTAERVTATMLSRASQGLWNGGHVPYGYDYESDRFLVNEKESQVCRFMAEDYLKHKSLIHTAMELNSNGFKTRSGSEWAAGTVWGILQNPFYIGTYRYNYYHGTKARVVNDKEDWIMVKNHHPAIFTKEEHERMLAIMEYNRTTQNTENQQNSRKYVHVFSQLCRCGKCGSNMVSMPSRVHSDGYRTSIYVCSKKKKAMSCDNPALIDIAIGDFVVNYVVNIIRAKNMIDNINTISDLQDTLLSGKAYRDVAFVDEAGLNSLLSLLKRYKKDDAYTLIHKPKRKKTDADKRSDAINKELDKQRRALKRLQDAFLYSDNGISEKDFIVKRQEILDKISESESRLRELDFEKQSQGLTDDEFISKASHLLITSRLKKGEYIKFKDLASAVAPDILKEYMRSIIAEIRITDKRITAITFRNGITHEFAYKKTGG